MSCENFDFISEDLKSHVCRCYVVQFPRVVDAGSEQILYGLHLPHPALHPTHLVRPVPCILPGV